MKRTGLLVIVLLLFFSLRAQGQVKMSAVQISVNQGLPHTDVMAFAQDDDGYLWIGTCSGLAKYDGTHIYSFNTVNSKLQNARIACLKYSRSGLLYIGTETAGLCILNTHTGDFHDNVEVPSNRVNSILEIEDRVWVGTDKGVSLINNIADSPSSSSWHLGCRVNGIASADGESEFILATSEGLKLFNEDTGQTTEISSGVYCTSMLGISQGEVMVTTRLGVFRYHFPAEKWEMVTDIPSTGICFDNESQIWISAETGRLLHLTDKGVETYCLESENIPNCSKVILNGVFCDQSSVLWTATGSYGCLRNSVNSRKFRYFPIIENSERQLPIALAADSKGNLWISTRNGSLYVQEPDGHTIRFNQEMLSAFHGMPISAIYQDALGRMWLGAWSGGFMVIDTPQLEKAVKGNSFSILERGLRSYTVNSFLEDGKGNIWIATNAGVVRYSMMEWRIVHRYENIVGVANSPSDDYTTAIAVSPRENGGCILWTGSRLGVTRFLCSSTGDVEQIKRIKPECLKGEFVSRIIVDQKQRIWITTLGGGLNMLESGFEDDDPVIVHYNTSNMPFPSDELESMELDSNGNLWIGSKGLTCFSPESGKLRNFNSSDGLQSNVFKVTVSAVLPDGKLAFGGINGYNIFDPCEITGSNAAVPPVQITNVLVNGKNVNADSIGRLKHNLNNITIFFATLDFENPQMNRYRYRLKGKGVNQDWQLSDGNKNSAQYLNLSPGNYLFEVYGANSGDVWNDTPATLSFKISPTPMASVPAFITYALLLILAISLYIRMHRIRLEKDHQLELERKLRLEEEERNRYELNLHTDFLHEIKTPLTLIKVPIEEMLKNANLGKNTRRRLNLINQSARILNKHIEELTSLRKMEYGELKLKVSQCDFRRFVKDVVLLFKPVTDSKNITLDLDGICKEPIDLWFDRNQMEKVVINLMSNAIKFSPEEGGLISIELFRKEDKVFFAVKNLGIGILPEDIDTVFNRFKQGKNNNRGGLGIGLTISKTIVEYHSGTISVSSVPGGETCFTICLPTGRNHFSDSQIVVPDEEDPVLEDIYPEGTTFEHEKLFTTVDREYTVLVVEDNEGLKHYFLQFLSSYYNVILAENGEKGYERALVDQPDLILSDIVMPKMSGLELCSKIRNNPDTAHIPVILVSARDLPVHKIEGFQNLADEYFTKPFDPEILISRIANLISLRETLRKNFSNTFSVDPSEITSVPADERFIKRALAFLESNIADGNYGVDELCSDMAVSRPQLYRKIKTITGESAIHFIKDVRLKRAAQLLASESLNSVSEVMEAVGFSNASYFSKIFFEKFGVLPKDYKKTTIH